MTGRVVSLVPTGTANIASVAAAIRRAGYLPRPATGPAAIASAAWVVLPGVGTLAAAARRLRRHGWLPAIEERLHRGRPTLAICLGMQLLARSSDESPGVAGLGWIPRHIRRLPDSGRVPQIGWNQVAPAPASEWIEPGYGYFANSYCLDEVPGADWQVAWSDHGIRFIAALWRDGLLGCQFHPELSGRWGQHLIERWLRGDIR